jgi:hypothetical protein
MERLDELEALMERGFKSATYCNMRFTFDSGDYLIESAPRLDYHLHGQFHTVFIAHRYIREINDSGD